MQDLLKAIVVVSALALAAGRAHAYDDLVDQLSKTRRWSEVIGDSDSRATVKDGVLRGYGTERTKLQPNGNLKVERTKVYTHVQHPTSGKLLKLPEAWKVHTQATLGPSLRLIHGRTRLDFKRSIDTLFSDFSWSERYSRYFEWDEGTLRSNKRGDRLTETGFKGGEQVGRVSYDYPQDAIPIDVVGLALAAAAKSGLKHFDFEVLMRGGDTHGIRSVMHRTRSLARHSKKYRLPSRIKKNLELSEETILIEMRLRAPIKRMFYPHRFFLAYASAEPDKLLAFWGGDPDGDFTYAFRDDLEK